MSEENLEVVREVLAAASRGDVDAIVALHHADWEGYIPAQYPVSGTWKGHTGLRSFIEEWLDAFDGFRAEPEELIACGDDAVLVVVSYWGTGRGSRVAITDRWFYVYRLRAGKVLRWSPCRTREEAEALAAAPLADAPATSANLELVRSIYSAWGRGDFSRTGWAHPDIEFVLADGAAPGSARGVAAMNDAWRDVLRAWQDFRAELESCRALDSERVLALTDNAGRGRASGLEVGGIRTKGANVFHVRDGRVTKLVAYWSRDRALADLGLTQGSDARS